MLNRPFNTLVKFQEIVDHCKVTGIDGAAMTLPEGLQRAVMKIQEVDRKKLSVILVGNGGSAAIASHQAVDLWKNGGIRAYAFNDASLLTCIGNDYGYDQVFAKPIETFAKPGDLVIAISSSGKSDNILNAVKSAKKAGCTVLTFSGFVEGNALSKLGDLNFYLKSDSYGIVEVGHLLLIHAVIDQVIREKTQSLSERNKSQLGQVDELHN